MIHAYLSFPAIDPIAFAIGPFRVRWYALAYVTGLLFALFYMKSLVRNPALWGAGSPRLSADQIDDLFVWAALGVVAGGRLGYVIFYDPSYFLTHPGDIFKLWQGGMSFHGGFLGVILASWVFAVRNGVGLDQVLDLAAAAVPVGLGLGRLANFVNGELFGRPSNVPWAMIFPGGGPMARHPSQIYEAVMEGLILFVAARIATHRYGALAHPGRVAGMFALGYGVVRIFAESFREPDPQIGYMAGNLTRGMVLSLPMLAIGIWLLLRSGKFTA